MDAVMGITKTKTPMGVVSTMLQLSAQTTSERMVLALRSKLIKKGRDTLGAPKGKKVRDVLFSYCRSSISILLLQ